MSRGLIRRAFVDVEQTSFLLDRSRIGEEAVRVGLGIRQEKTEHQADRRQKSTEEKRRTGNITAEHRSVEQIVIDGDLCPIRHSRRSWNRLIQIHIE